MSKKPSTCTGHLSKRSMVVGVIVVGAFILAYMTLVTDLAFPMPVIFHSRIFSNIWSSNTTVEPPLSNTSSQMTQDLPLKDKEAVTVSPNGFPNAQTGQKETEAGIDTQKAANDSKTNQSVDRAEKVKDQQKVEQEAEVTTTVTYDPSLVVRCKKTAYLRCSSQRTSSDASGSDANAKRVFHIAFLRKPEWLAFDQRLMDTCPYSACLYDGGQVTEQTDVVILNNVGLDDRFQLPRHWPHQLYAASTWESPLHTRATYLRNGKSFLNSYFNLTITYRTDADVFVPYNKLKFDPKPVDQRPNYLEIAKKKTKMVAWLVSNCRTPSRRREYVQQMKNHIQVDIYGGCGTPCNDQCFKNIKKDYRFYLAFENSLCTDYVTEKFFKFYEHDTHLIQVTRGGSDYNRHFPEMTFINAADFKTAKDLALFLKKLAEDPVLFSHYLEHKDLYTNTGEGMGATACKLCTYLHTHDRQQKVYDMKAWMGDGKCHDPTDLG